MITDKRWIRETDPTDDDTQPVPVPLPLPPQDIAFMRAALRRIDASPSLMLQLLANFPVLAVAKAYALEFHR